MTIENINELDLNAVHQGLKRKYKDYEYTLLSDTIVVTKNDNVKLNVIVKEEVIAIYEAVPFVTKMAVAIGTLGLGFYILHEFNPPLWAKVIGYIFSFLLGGQLGDLYHHFRFKKEYDPFRKNIETVIKSL